MLLNKNKGFTLAELMIVFTVIGIIAAVLIPILFMASPDQPELKARKAYNSFVRTMESLTNGKPYDMNNGLLDATALVTGEAEQNNFFCNNLAEYMNVKHINCNNSYGEGLGQLRIPGVVSVYASNAPKRANGTSNYDGCYPNCPQNLYFDNTNHKYLYDSLMESLDNLCIGYFTARHSESDYNFITSDKVGWAIQKYRFNHGAEYFVNVDNEGNTLEEALRAVHTYGGITTHTLYSAVCINTANDLHSGDTTNVYAMGVNREGKVIPGRKLQDLIEKTVKK